MLTKTNEKYMIRKERNRKQILLWMNEMLDDGEDPVEWFHLRGNNMLSGYPMAEDEILKAAMTLCEHGHISLCLTPSGKEVAAKLTRKRR